MDSYGDESKTKLPHDSWLRMKEMVDYLRRERGLTSDPNTKLVITNSLAWAILIDKGE